jgi:hypothetical protein
MDDQAADGANDTEAASEPARPDPITGDLVTASFDYDGGRQVTVYVPADGPEAVVFAGDGQLISHWGGYLEAADLPPTMIVGAYRTDEKDETVRIHEYSPLFDAVRFAAHESFFVEDVRRWVRSRFGVALPAERTAVCGVSASGELSLAMGLRHPDLYGDLRRLRARLGGGGDWADDLQRTPHRGPPHDRGRSGRPAWRDTPAFLLLPA